MTGSLSPAKWTILLLFIMAGAPTAQCQTFASLVARLNSLPEPARQAVADSFMNAGHLLPYAESDTLVHFVYNSPATAVSMAGDATGWNPNRIFTLVSGCNFRYLDALFDPDARLDYKLVINSGTWILDPGNPFTCTGGFGPNSELRMPAYQVPPEVSYHPAIPHGTVKDTIFHSALLGNSRHVWIYLPPGYPSGVTAYPLILFHDGPDYLNLGNAANILDYLISEHLVAPVIGIFVPPVDRTAEYAGSSIDKFTGFVTDELMPVIDARYQTSTDPANRAMAGASDGGNISLYIGMKHPEQFGKIAAQSSDVQTVISNTFSTGPRLNLALYIDIGTYDIAELIPMVHGLRDILQSNGYSYQFREWHEGHSWGNWKGHLRLPLMQFFPYTTGMNEPSAKPGPELLPNRPNPFHDLTLIPFKAENGSDIEISVTDITGRITEIIYSGKVSGSGYTIGYHHHQKPGSYILTLSEHHKIRSSEIIQAF